MYTVRLTRRDCDVEKLDEATRHSPFWHARLGGMAVAFYLKALRYSRTVGY